MPDSTDRRGTIRFPRYAYDVTRAGAEVTEAVGRVWPRTARLDAPQIIDRIADITGVRLILEGPAPGGEVGAAFVRWPDGRRSVLTEGRSRSGPLVDRARRAGVPTARHELAAHVDGSRVIVQQRLPGAPPETVDQHLVRQLVALNDRLAGLLLDVPAPKPSELYLTSDGPGFCLHQPLAEHSARTAALLERIHAVGAANGSAMVGDDLVHFDFHPGNVLVDDGRVTGLIDWDGATRGDRHFDLVTLRFWLTGRPDELLAPIDQRLAGISRRRRDAYWAHISLRMVDWSIRHHDEPAVEHWLTVAESGLDGDRRPS